MSAKDVKENAVSNVTVTNHADQPVTVSGIFIASFDINDCSACFGSIVSGDNLGGAVVGPVTFAVNQTVPIGQNYLYRPVLDPNSAVGGTWEVYPAETETGANAPK